MRLLPIAAAVLAATAARAGAGPPEESAVLEAEARRMDAMVRGDTGALGRILADDLTYTHASGVVDTKASLLSSLSSGRLKYKSIERADPRVRVYGDVAIVNGRAKVRNVTAQGVSAPFTILFTDVYLRKPDRAWQQVSWQSTRLPEPSPAP